MALSPWQLFRRVKTTPFPMRQPSYLVGRGSGRVHPIHTHRAFIDKAGNGTTSIDVSHYHRIVDGRILPDESDSHEHAILRVRTGSGI